MAVSDITYRVFEQGKNSSGAKIGRYNDRNPLYVDTKTKAPITQPPIGKTGKARFKDGKPHKTTYYKSYKDFRSKQKRESGFVNLRLTNELQSDFANANVSKTSTSVASAKPTKITAHHYQIKLKKPINQEKVESIEKKYGRVFHHTKIELEHFMQVLNSELAVALNGG